MTPNPATVLKVAQHMATSALAITVWDWLVSLFTEYHRVWKGRWTPAKILYIFNRYWSFVNAAFVVWLGVGAYMTYEECSHLFRLHVAIPMWGTLASEAILALRTYVFLGRDKRLLAILMLGLLCECAYFLVVVAKGVKQVPTPIGTCGASGSSDRSTNLVTFYFVVPVIFDFFVTVLTIVKAVQLRRSGVRSSSLDLFVREGLIYFIVVTSLNIVNLGFFTQPDQLLQGVMSALTIQISSILTCRLVLSLLDPKIARPASASDGSFQTGFETKHDTSQVSGTQDGLPSTLDKLDREERQVGSNPAPAESEKMHV